MKVVIVEDERAAAENLKYLLSEVDENILVDTVIDTVSDANDYFNTQPSIELAFFDIHLADGISFEIFNKVQVKVPVIFTTAYDEYAIKAFKFNSIDYLLKPIDKDELKEALFKYKSSKKDNPFTEEFKQILSSIGEKTRKYKTTFLVQQRDLLIPIDVNDIAYFTIDFGVVKAFTFDTKSYIVDEKLEDIELKLNPQFFFRANRQFIVQRRAIKNLAIYFNGKLILTIEPKPTEKIVISKAKAPLIKDWINKNSY